MKKRDMAGKPEKAPAPGNDELAQLEAEIAAVEAASAAAEASAASAPAAAEPASKLETQVAEWQAQAADWKDRALRAAADFDNFRKRAFKEREDAATRGQAEILSRIIEVVDDLARVAHLDPAQTAAEALHEGMLAIERKFMARLEAAGVERVDPASQVFDPNSHEAVTMMPAATPEQDGTVGTVFQAGYRFKGALLRPARVAVLKWNPPAAG